MLSGALRAPHVYRSVNKKGPSAKKGISFFKMLINALFLIISSPKLISRKLEMQFFFILFEFRKF